MNVNKLLLFTVCFLFLSFSYCTFKEENDKSINYPSGVSKYEFLRYSGGQEIFSPEIVVKADNNWEILLFCLGGKTRQELRGSEIVFTESQLMLLKAMGFLDIVEDSGSEKIRTTLPILGSSEKQALIQTVRSLVFEIEPELRDDILALKDTLYQNGWEEHAFSILFSGIVDGIVWFPFRFHGLVNEFKLNRDRPLYDGVYWAYYPKRDFRCGSNIAIGKDVFIVLNWSDGPQKKIQEVFHWDNLYAIRDDFLEHGRIVSEDLKHELKSYEVLDDNGAFTVPIIEIDESDEVFLICQSMATKIVGLINQKLNLERIQEEFGFADKEKAFVVTYHEWMWEFMEYLDEQGVVKKPFAFSHPEEAKPKDIGKLLLIVKGSIPH